MKAPGNLAGSSADFEIIPQRDASSHGEKTSIRGQRALQFAEKLGLATSGAKALGEEKGLIAALKALRHPKESFSAKYLIALFIMLVIICTGVGLAQTNELGIFTNQGSVGQTPPGGTAHYDAAKGEYRITGGGANVWGTADAFYFVWKKASGDITLTADVQWVGTSSAEHRKALLMIRQSLDPGSAYADAVSHGNGLTSLQFRGGQ